MKAKNILTLSHEEAMDFFLKSEQFHNFELPEYLDFSKILEYIKQTVGDKKFEECLVGDSKPENVENINLDILLNKDGKYAVRPLILTNPYLYYFMVREICEEGSWKLLKDCFNKFKVPNINSCAIPVVPQPKEPFHKSTTILNWWNSMEQRSIELSLEYRYIFVTDITNCYGSMNPVLFESALKLTGTQYERNSDIPVAANIRKFIQTMLQGRNIGIPQGSALFDFLSEIILGYADLLLYERIGQNGIETQYEILRYRDDYRIFCNDKDELERISYILQQVLEELNLRMNSQKTKITDTVIMDSIKSDKLFYIYNTPIFNKKGVDFDSFEKHLLYILMFGRQFRNGGQLKVLLSDLDRRMADWLKPKEVEETTIPVDWGDGTPVEEPKKTTRKIIKKLVGGSVRAMSAVAAQIALENVNASHYALRIISRMVDSLKDEEERWDIINKVYAKLCHMPNSSYNQLWLQNITYQQDKRNGKSPYDMRLCRLVAGEDDVQLWNNAWLKPELTAGLPVTSAVNQERLQNCTPVITFREIRTYYDDFLDLDI